MIIGKILAGFFILFGYSSSDLEKEDLILFSSEEISSNKISQTKKRILEDLTKISERKNDSLQRIQELSKHLFKIYLRDNEKKSDNFIRKIFQKEYFDFLFLKESKKEVENKVSILNDIFEETTGFSKSEFKKLDLKLAEFLKVRKEVKSLVQEIKNESGWTVNKCDNKPFSKIKPLCLQKDNEEESLTFLREVKVKKWHAQNASKQYIDVDIGKGMRLSFSVEQNEEVGLKSSSKLGPFHNDELRVFFFWKEHMISLGDFL